MTPPIVRPFSGAFSVSIARILVFRPAPSRYCVDVFDFMSHIGVDSGEGGWEIVCHMFSDYERQNKNY